MKLSAPVFQSIRIAGMATNQTFGSKGRPALSQTGDDSLENSDLDWFLTIVFLVFIFEMFMLWARIGAQWRMDLGPIRLETNESEKC